MKIALLIWSLVGAAALAAPSVEKRVLEVLKQNAQSQQALNFSDLYNDRRFNEEERRFLGRLYEIFFELPGYLKSEYQASGRVPTRAQTAAQFGISAPSVELLLSVMAADPRVPPLFKRDAQSREIVSLDLANIELFLKRRGSQVKITQWENQALPPFSLKTFEGASLSNRDLLGKPALLYFWFSGCPPCVRIGPHLAVLSAKFPELKVVGLNADRILDIEVSDQKRAEYLRSQGLNFVNVHLDQATRQAYGNINVFPTLFLVRPNGTIFRHLLNYQDQKTLETLAAQLTRTD